MRTKSTVYLGDEEREALAQLKERHGIKTDADAIRYAIRLAVKSKPKGKKERES